MSSIDASVDDVPGVESNICESLNNPHQLSEAEQRDITDQFEPLTDNGVELVGASPTGSIFVYFLCGSFEAVIFFKKSYDLGELQRIVEYFRNNFCAKPYVPRESRRDPSNRRLSELGTCYIFDTARNRTYNLFRPYCRFH